MRSSSPPTGRCQASPRRRSGDIKVGVFVGIASAPAADGSEGALEVVIFPAALKGTGEGSRPWNLSKPNSSMTNATVADAVTRRRRPHRHADL